MTTEPTYYERNRKQILAKCAAQRRARGAPIRRGGAGRKKVPARLIELGCARCHHGFLWLRKAGRSSKRQPRFCVGCRQPLLPRKSCDWCGTQLKRRKGRFCSFACAVEWIRVTQKNPFKRESVRKRRQRASAARQKALRLVRGRQKVGRWREICERDGWVCWICGGPIDPAFTSPQRFAGTVDHVLPLSCGGSDQDFNLRAAHFGCNSRRGAAKFMPDMEEVVA